MTIEGDMARALAEAEQLWAGALSTAKFPDDLGVASGCGEWTNADLVNHVAGGGERYGMLLRGCSAADTTATRDKDYIGNDALGEFWRHEHMMRTAAESADLAAPVDHRLGPRSGAALLNMRIMDLTLHANDLRLGVGTQWNPSDWLTTYLMKEVGPTIEELRGIGVFGPATTPRSESSGNRLLGLAGR